MRRSVSKRVGAALLAAIIIMLLVATSEGDPTGAMAAGWVAEYTQDDWGMRESMIYGSSTTIVCWGYGFAASFAFGPVGAAAFGGACAGIMLA